MVGLFFYIDSVELEFSGILSHAIDEKDAFDSGDFLNDELGHDKLFEQKFPFSDVEYFDFPRGRIVYNKRKNQHTIYIDKCLNNSKFIVEIKKIFRLENLACRVSFDEHYVCAKCVRF